MQIRKRNGELKEFDSQKIVDAINRAFIEVDGKLYEDDTSKEIAEDIYSYFLCHRNIQATVELVQDMVEEELMASERKDVARAYVRYRYKEEVRRNSLDDFIKPIMEKLNGTHYDRQNANIDGCSFGGRTGEAASTMTKRLALDYLISKKARDNHINNRIYIHNL